MRWTVIEHEGKPVDGESTVVLFAPGGTIGRSPDNHLVLPDEQRRISRLQATVRFDQTGQVRLRNMSTVMPIDVNGRNLMHGGEESLQPGDRVTIGSYVLQVQDTAPTDVSVSPSGASSAGHPVMANLPSLDISDPFSGLLGAGVRPLGAAYPAAQARSVPPAPPAVEAAQPASAAQPQSHPTASRPVAVDWDAIIANAPRRDDGSARVSTPDPLKRDPFSQPSQTKRNPIDPLVDLARMEDGGANDPMRERSIDPLALFAEDPHAPSPLSDPRPTALIDAPVLHDVHPATELLAPGPPPAGPSQADHGHEIASQFSPPLPVAKSLSESPVGVEPACAQPPTCSRPLATAAVIAPFIEDARSDASPEHASEMPLLGANGDTAMLEQLFHAFLEGAGVPDVAGQQPVSIDTMRRIGRLLRAFTDGAMELLASRAMLKREVRAEITMIVDEENNPFKILPSGRAVLMQMFGARMPGFLSPEAAVSDALGDLHLHQLGMVAGMRAALLMVLQRFDPGALDIKTPHDGTLSERLLPGGRHLRLWRELRRLHDETTSAVEDDFHAVFGHAFQQAYDKEMDRLREARHA